MAPSLEVLPGEIIDRIADYLPISDIVGLWRCSKTFHPSAKRLLFGSPAGLARTMMWACKNGDSNIISVAVAHGANPSWLCVPVPKNAMDRSVRARRAGRMKSEQKMFTLTMAAQHRHEDAFSALLELGAGVEEMRKRDRRNLLKPLQSREGWISMRSLLEAGIGPKVIRDFDVYFDLLITLNAPVYILRLLLEQGADVNAMLWGWRRFPTTPLSTAIKVNRPEIVALLLERGADVHRPRESLGTLAHRRHLYRQLEHIPIFAAAINMGKTGSTEIMELCLRRRANINFVFQHLWMASPRGGIRRCNHTPFLAYLEALETLPVEHRVEIRTGLEFFFDHGTHFQLPNMDTSSWTCIPRRHRRFTLDIVIAAEECLTRWNMQSVRRSELFEGLVYFVERRIGLVKARRIPGTH